MLKREYIADCYAGYQLHRYMDSEHRGARIIRCVFKERGVVVYYIESASDNFALREQSSY